MCEYMCVYVCVRMLISPMYVNVCACVLGSLCHCIFLCECVSARACMCYSCTTWPEIVLQWTDTLREIEIRSSSCSANPMVIQTWIRIISC